MNLSITIITPSFNQGQFIERTIQSVLQQAVPNLNYLVMDGCSTDETLNVLKRYENQLRWISQFDHGQADAINSGFSNTTSDIIGWLNSDDIYYPDAIATVMEYFKQHPEIDVVYGDANHIDINDRIIELYPTESWNIKRLQKTCFISQPAVFFRRRVLEQYGMLNPELHYCLDYEFWLRLGLNGAKFAYIPKILAGSRLYPETKTLRNPAVCYLETLNMLRERLGYVPAAWLLNYALLRTKQLLRFRIPGVRFVSMVMLASYLNMRWNGVLRGLVMSLFFPVSIIELVVYQRKF